MSGFTLAEWARKLSAFLHPQNGQLEGCRPDSCWLQGPHLVGPSRASRGRQKLAHWRRLPGLGPACEKTAPWWTGVCVQACVRGSMFASLCVCAYVHTSCALLVIIVSDFMRHLCSGLGASLDWMGCSLSFYHSGASQYFPFFVIMKCCNENLWCVSYVPS